MLGIFYVLDAISLDILDAIFLECLAICEVLRMMKCPIEYSSVGAVLELWVYQS